MRNKSIEALVRNEFKITDDQNMVVKFDCSIGNKEHYDVVVYDVNEDGILKTNYEIIIELVEKETEYFNI
ncbi:MAG: hypothetical protein RSC93_01275 [Erysipelotrichaceae bacterium]